MASLMDSITGANKVDYSKGYDPSNLAALTNQYAQALQPQYDKQAAQIANIAGGQGTFQGTGTPNNLSNLYSGMMSQLGQYTGGLQQGALQQQYQNPLDVANLTGMYTNPTTGAQTPTIAGQQETTISPYQQQELDIAKNQQDLQSLQNIIGYFGGVQGLMSMLGGQGGSGGLSGLLGQTGINTSTLGNTIGSTGNALSNIGTGAWNWLTK